MNAIALAVAILALVVSVVSALYSRRTTKVAEDADRRERTPSLTITPERQDGDIEQVFYQVRNNGPQDLDSVVIYRPRTDDQVVYPLALVGSGWADDEIDLGPIAVAETARFMHFGGQGPRPEFHARIVCRAGADEWTLTTQLGLPRRGTRMRYVKAYKQP